MPYRIKFLQRTEIDGNNEARPVYFTQAFTDTDIADIAARFKGVGLARVEEIELITGKDGKEPKLTALQVVELFYPAKTGTKDKEIALSEYDQKIKASLLAKYVSAAKKPDATAKEGEKPKKEVVNILDKPIADMNDKEIRLFKAAMIAKIEKLTGNKPHHMNSPEKLAEMLKRAEQKVKEQADLDAQKAAAEVAPEPAQEPEQTIPPAEEGSENSESPIEDNENEQQ